MTTKYNHFKRFQKPTFTCELCDRLTRDTGQGVDHLCKHCYDLCSIDNHCNDSGETLQESRYAAEVAAAVASIEKAGGNVQKVKDFCGYLFPKEGA